MTTRSHMTEADKAEVWTRRARGEPVQMIARHMGRDRGTVWKVVTATGGIPPRTPQRSCRELTVGEREELSRGLAMGESCRAMARRLGRAPSTVSREVHRNGADRAIERPKPMWPRSVDAGGRSRASWRSRLPCAPRLRHGCSCIGRPSKFLRG